MNYRKLVVDQIVNAIQNDLDGDEALMKEVFEEVDTVAGQQKVNKELRAVIELLQEYADSAQT